MFTYLTGENILFSNDAFGQHYATESLYGDAVDEAELFAEARKYYANILTPFSAQVTKKIHELLGMNLPISMICPSHGVIWRREPTRIVEQYLAWAADYQEDQITIVYDSMWGATRTMAEAMAVGIARADKSTTVKLFNAAKTDKNDIITEVFRSKAILVGSSTINNGHLFSISGLLEMIRGLRFKNKRAAAFGSYGWSGEAVKQLTAKLREAGFLVEDEGRRALWAPDEAERAACAEFGEKFANALKS
ncbi:MAG: flavodoxin domain-containing protein, partial [Christensenellales bacterium]|jgi:anaerobic nitric oxide reductase flavorubredoxin